MLFSLVRIQFQSRATPEAAVQRQEQVSQGKRGGADRAAAGDAAGGEVGGQGRPVLNLKGQGNATSMMPPEEVARSQFEVQSRVVQRSIYRQRPGFGLARNKRKCKRCNTGGS